LLLGRAAGDSDTIETLAAYAAWAAAGCDVLENVGLRLMLGTHTGQPVPLLTGVVSAAKWLLIGAAAAGVLVLAVWAILF
jgi:hypothetical protein